MWQKLQQIALNLSESCAPGLAELPVDVRSQLRIDYGQAPWGGFVFYILMAVALIGILHVSQVYLPSNNLTRNISGILFIVACFAYFAMVLLFGRRSHKRWLYTELNRLGHRPSRCPCCGNDLRGTPDTSTACPECGATIAPITPGTHEST
jgi:hypothetical protein